jgi:hypothetical protein
MDEIPEYEGWARSLATAFCLFSLAERLVMNPILQILWIYVIIKLVFDLMQSMTMILCLE